MRQGNQFQSPIGLVTVFLTNDVISCVRIGEFLQLSDRQQMENEVLTSCRRQFEEYFAGHRKTFDLPLDWKTISGFQFEVLSLTRRIPFGEVRTYGDIARDLGKPAASRAVGKALGQNPLPILIPCHRVVAASGHLTGFSAADGITSKTWLLQLEGHRIVAEKLG